MKKKFTLLLLLVFLSGAIPANAMGYAPNQMPMQNNYQTQTPPPPVMNNQQQIAYNNRRPEPPKKQKKKTNTAKVIGGTLIGAVAGGVLTSYLTNK